MDNNSFLMCIPDSFYLEDFVQEFKGIDQDTWAELYEIFDNIKANISIFAEDYSQNAFDAVLRICNKLDFILFEYHSTVIQINGISEGALENFLIQIKVYDKR